MNKAKSAVNKKQRLSLTGISDRVLFSRNHHNFKENCSCEDVRCPKDVETGISQTIKCVEP